jgi:hypothetical protein
MSKRLVIGVLAIALVTVLFASRFPAEISIESTLRSVARNGVVFYSFFVTNRTEERVWVEVSFRPEASSAANAITYSKVMRRDVIPGQVWRCEIGIAPSEFTATWTPEVRYRPNPSKFQLLISNLLNRIGLRQHRTQPWLKVRSDHIRLTNG